MVNTRDFDSGGSRLFSGGQEVYLLFNSDIVNFKTSRGRDRRPNFVIFVAWSIVPRNARVR